MLPVPPAGAGPGGGNVTRPGTEGSTMSRPLTPKQTAVLRRARTILARGYANGHWLRIRKRDHTGRKRRWSAGPVLDRPVTNSHEWREWREAYQRTILDDGGPNGADPAEPCACGNGAIYCAAAEAEMEYDDVRALVETVGFTDSEVSETIPAHYSTPGDADSRIIHLNDVHGKRAILTQFDAALAAASDERRTDTGGEEVTPAT